MSAGELPLIDEFALRAIAAAAERGDEAHIDASCKVLCPLLRLIYGKDFNKIIGIAPASGGLRRYESLSRFTPAAPRVFVLANVCNSEAGGVVASVALREGRVSVTVAPKSPFRRVELMLTSAPHRMLTTRLPAKRKHSWLEVIDVHRVTHIRFLIWVGKELTARVGSSFGDAYRGTILPILVDQTSDMVSKTTRVHDIPLSEVCAELC